MSSNQSEELEKKWYVQSQSRTMFFQVWEKWYVQWKATEMREFRAKIQREKTIKYGFSRRKVKNISEIGLE